MGDFRSDGGVNLLKHNDLILTYYTPGEYPKYDSYDAIEVSKVAEIPCDSTGVVGVPITFLDKYSLEQFEILELWFSICLELGLPLAHYLLSFVGKLQI
ncbi:MAG: adenine-specific methyltransferase EcoRI family protein [Oscillospiraceae bacterium]